MNLQEKGERGLGQSSPLSSFYAIVPIDILHGAVCSLLMILIPCAVDGADGIFSKVNSRAMSLVSSGKVLLKLVKALPCRSYRSVSRKLSNKLRLQPFSTI